MSRHFYLFSLTMFLSFGPVLCLGQGYSLADLEALEKERSFQEFFQHAWDIRPADRNEYWKTMLQNMAELYLKSLLKKNRLAHSDFLQVEQLASFALLREFEFFRLQRNRIGVNWLTHCLKLDAGPRSSCWEDLQLFWSTEKQDPDTAKALFSLLSPYLKDATFSEIPSESRKLVDAEFILKPLLQSPLAALQCKKDEIQKVVWNSLKTLWSVSGEPNSLAPSLNRIAHPDCWQALAPELKKKWLKGSSAEELHLAYSVLKHFGLANDNERDLFYLTYLLNTPMKGELFNMAWSRLEELRKAPGQREELVRQMKNWASLPGEIFADKDELRRRAVSRHIQRSLPEYLDYYAHTCINFFSGKVAFPEGNPAHRCRELFQLADQEEGLLPVLSLKTFKSHL